MILAFLQRHWRVFAVLLLLVCAGVGGYSAGRFGTPAKVEIQEKIVEVEVEKIVEVEKVVIQERIVHDQAVKRRTHREIVTIKAPDGTTTTTRVEDVGTDSQTHDAAVKTEDRIVTRDVVKYVDREVSKTISVEKPLPDWRIHVLGGVNILVLPGLVQGVPFNALTHLTVGAQVERRIWGPLNVGVFGLSSGQVGLSVALEF